MIGDEQRAEWRAKRRYWPDCVLDEVMPSGRSAPDAWLDPDVDGVTAVLWDEDDELREADKLSPGETIAFWWTEPRGSCSVEIFPDGTWQLKGSTLQADLFTEAMTGQPSSAIPDDATWFWLDEDWEFADDSLDALAREYGTYLNPGEAEVMLIGMRAEGTEYFLLSADGRSFTPTIKPAEPADQNVTY